MTKATGTVASKSNSQKAAQAEKGHRRVERPFKEVYKKYAKEMNKLFDLKKAFKDI